TAVDIGGEIARVARLVADSARPEDPDRAGLRQAMSRQPGCGLAGQRAAGRAAVDADLRRLHAFQQLAIDRGDILARRWKDILRPFAIIDRDDLPAAKRGDRDRLDQRAGIGAMLEAAAVQVDQYPRLVGRAALGRDDARTHPGDALLDDVDREA